MPDKDKKGLVAFDLFSYFTRLRQNGVNRDEAWYQVCDATPEVTDVTRKAFLKLAKDWERREGYKYHYRQEDTQATLTRNQIGDVRQAQQQQQNQAQPQYPNPGLTSTLDPVRRREHELRNLERILDQTEEEDGSNGHRAQQPLQPGSKPSPQGTAPMRYPPDFSVRARYC
jgi:hypothetical protein